MLFIPPHLLPDQQRWLQALNEHDQTSNGGATSSGPEWKEALLRPVKVCRQVCFFDHLFSKSVTRFVWLIIINFLPLLKLCRQTSLLALAPACIVTGLHHVVMERRDQGGTSGNILRTGCNRTSGQVVVVVACPWKSFVAQEKISPSFQVLAGLLTWWLGGVGVEGETSLIHLKLDLKKDRDNSFYLSRLKLNQKGSRGLAIAGACSCVSGLGLLLLPQLGLDVNNGGKDGSEMLAAAVPALLGVGDGLINLQVLLFYFQGCDLP